MSAMNRCFININTYIIYNYTNMGSEHQIFSAPGSANFLIGNYVDKMWINF